MERQRPTCEEIGARAYQIYLESGRRHGHDIDDWLQAEYELMQMPVDQLANLAAPQTSKTRREAKSIIEVVRAAML
jgi:hypothetical protein